MDFAQKPSFRPIPRPQLGDVGDLTPFTHVHVTKMGVGRRFFDVLVVKGAFELTPGVLRPSPHAPTIAFSDEPLDEDKDERSGLRRACDVVLDKVGTDVYVTGSASAPDGRPSAGWVASVEVAGGTEATTCRSALQVSGPRRWEHRRVLGWAIGDAEPTTSVPVQYELAYGGAYLDRDPEAEHPYQVYEPNAAGLGFVDAGALDKEARYAAPQWQDAEHPVTRFNQGAPLAGFGPVPRAWSSRLAHAGTYDDAWLAQAKADAARDLPVDYPKDFSLKFFQSAHPALTTARHLRGDEPMRLVGLAKQPSLATRLPGVALRCRVFRPRGPCVELAPMLDTVAIDLDAARVELTWRLPLSHHLGIKKALLYVKEAS